jgi:hypothetical protein
VRKTFYTKEGLEFADRGTVAEQESNLPSRFESKQEHRHPGEGQTGKRIGNLEGIAGVRDVGKQVRKPTKKMVEGPDQSTHQLLLLLLRFFFKVRDSL